MGAAALLWAMPRLVTLSGVGASQPGDVTAGALPDASAGQDPAHRWPAGEASALTVKHLNKSFDKNQILHDISLDVHKDFRDSIITSKNYELGDLVAPGKNLGDISAVNDIYVLSYVPIKYLDKVSYGQLLEVQTPLGTRQGKVVYIDVSSEDTPKDMQSTADTERESVKVKVGLAGDGGNLKAGMAADVVIPLA